MRQGTRTLVVLLLATLLAGGVAVWVRAEENYVRVEVEITAKEGGEPIDNASVYLKFKEERFLLKDKKREWSVKTNRDGKAIYPVVPEGEVLIQVVAKGWKTFGKYYTLEGPKQSIKIELEKPKKWY